MSGPRINPALVAALLAAGAVPASARPHLEALAADEPPVPAGRRGRAERTARRLAERAEAKRQRKAAKRLREQGGAE
jgi:hypothetical protein